eukprot:SAG11_NODE_3246_length_2583_cov_3.256844_1_plen_299_part_00
MRAAAVPPLPRSVAQAASNGPAMTARESSANLSWDDPAFQAQAAKYESDDEDLFVVLDSDGRIDDGTVDYKRGGSRFPMEYGTIPLLASLLTREDGRATLRRDCQQCCFPFTDSAFWLPANLQPRCTLEAVTRALFDHHTRGMKFDRARSGCEWWAQIRRASTPNGARAAAAAPVAAAAETIGMHWDKDEQLNVAVGGLYVQPQIACVTYLSDSGAPTVVAPFTPHGRVPSANDGDGDIDVCFPRRGKTMCFDGRLLHGAPAELKVPTTIRARRGSRQGRTDAEGSATNGEQPEQRLA